MRLAPDESVVVATTLPVSRANIEHVESVREFLDSLDATKKNAVVLIVEYGDVDSDVAEQISALRAAGVRMRIVFLLPLATLDDFGEPKKGKKNGKKKGKG